MHVSGDWAHVGVYGGQGIMNVSGTADATFHGNLNVSYQAPGTLTQTDGKIDAKADLLIGYYWNANGTVDIANPINSIGG